MDPHWTLIYAREGVRSWQICNSETELCLFFIELYETDRMQRVKQQVDRLGPGHALPEVIQYDAADLFNYMDLRMTDIAVLKFLPEESKYIPLGRNWLKTRIYEYLRANVQQAVDE